MIGPPELLAKAHETAAFSCGEASLDDWLRRRALQNQYSGASRTYVAAEGRRVVGYYALAAGAVTASEATDRARRDMPDSVPVMALTRLAVDSAVQGRGLGLDLLRDAVLRTLAAAEIVGVRALLVSAISDRTARFYEKAGFSPSPLRPGTYMLVLADARAALEASR